MSYPRENAEAWHDRYVSAMKNHRKVEAERDALRATIKAVTETAQRWEDRASRLDRSLTDAFARLDAVDALFNGGPDTSCRTVWDEGIECVSVPMGELRAALAAAGVDREDTEQPQETITSTIDNPHGHVEWQVGDTGQADEPLRTMREAVKSVIPADVLRNLAQQERLPQQTTCDCYPDPRDHEPGCPGPSGDTTGEQQR